MPVYATLDALGIPYEKFTRIRRFSPPRKSPRTGPASTATKVKNLFLRNKKGDRHYLVILEIAKQADLRRS